MQAQAKVLRCHRPKDYRKTEHRGKIGPIRAIQTKANSRQVGTFRLSRKDQ
jgi:hypothetical protein